MKELPIFNKEWLIPRVSSHAIFDHIIKYDIKNKTYDSMASYCHYDLHVYLKVAQLRSFSVFSLNNQSKKNNQLKLSNRYLFFMDELDNSFYYLDLKSETLKESLIEREYIDRWDSLTDHDTAIKAISSVIIDTLGLKSSEIPEITIGGNIINQSIRKITFGTDYVDDSNIEVPKDKLATYIDTIFDKLCIKFQARNWLELKGEKLSKHTVRYLRDKMSHRILSFDKYAEKIIQGGWNNTTDYDIINYNAYRDECIEKILFEENDKILIKQLLTRKDDRFSGDYKVILHHASNVKNKSYIDGIDVEIGMMARYSDNIKFITENQDKIFYIIRKILETDKKSSQYANFLQSSSIKLMRDQVLLVQLKFKDGFKEIFKEMEEEDEGI